MEVSSAGFTIAFRPMTVRDVVRVHQIDSLSFSMPWSERSYRFELTENKSSLCFVAEVVPSVEGAPSDDGSQRVVVGMIVLWVILDEVHVATIATHPDYRGKGIGRMLLATGLLAAYERGARMAYLEVRRGNQSAKKIYQQFGFQHVGERLRYYKDNNEDALLMTLDPIDEQALRKFLGPEASSAG
jgi:ribosomal-protein-alanine N-acetyltransferase